jgi:hypothetical protein
VVRARSSDRCQGHTAEKSDNSVSDPNVEQIDESLRALLWQLGGTPTLGAVCRQRDLDRAQLMELMLEARQTLTTAEHYRFQAEQAADAAIGALGLRPRTTHPAEADAQAYTQDEARRRVREQLSRDGDTPVARVRARAERLAELEKAGVNRLALGACRLLRGEDWWWETVFGDKD